MIYSVDSKAVGRVDCSCRNKDQHEMHPYLNFLFGGRRRKGNPIPGKVISKDKDREIITYCDTGTCCPTWYFILKEVLGYKRVYLYDCSIDEWTADPSAPVQLNGNGK